MTQAAAAVPATAQATASASTPAGNGITQVGIDKLFGVPNPLNRQLPVRPATQYTPTCDPDYLFREDLLQVMSLWYFCKDYNNLYIAGPTGSGKSSLPEQFCGRLGIEMFRVACHGRMDMSHLIGHLTMKSKTVSVKDKFAQALLPFKALLGSESSKLELELEKFSAVPSQPTMEFELGPLPLAMLRGGVLLLDEFDTLPPAVALGLNGVMDGAGLLVPETGQWIKLHPNFRIALTGNTAGSGDTATGGLYKGTNTQNLALMDRVICLQVDYMDEVQEEKVLRKIPNVTDMMVKMGLELASSVRAAFKSGELQATLSTRGLKRWVKLGQQLNGSSIFTDPANEALKFVLLNKCLPQDRVAIQAMFDKISGRT